MSGYLLDTSVLSLLAPGRPAVPPELAEWLRRESDRLFIPVVAVAEIVEGISKLRRNGAAKRAATFEGWIETMIESYADRVLPFDTKVARKAGEMADAARENGRHPGFPDIAIAAIAKDRKLTILTGNIRHFEPLGVPAIDSFALAMR